MPDPYFHQCDFEPLPDDPLVAALGFGDALKWSHLRHCTLPEPLPRPVAFHLREHRSAYSFWQDARGLAQLPPMELIDPTAFAGALGCVLLLEPERGGEDFRYRIYGSRVAQRFGRDMTGHRVSDFPGPAASSMLSQYREVMRIRRAIYSEHDAPLEVSLVVRWCRLVLPWVDRTGAVSRLMVANVPVERPVAQLVPRLAYGGGMG